MDSRTLCFDGVIFLISVQIWYAGTTNAFKLVVRFGECAGRCCPVSHRSPPLTGFMSHTVHYKTINWRKSNQQMH